MSDSDDTAIRLIMMPADTNPGGTIFGGVILSRIDMAGWVGARREVVRAGGPQPELVTVAVNRVEFKRPVYVGELVTFRTRLVKFGSTSVTVTVFVEAERDTQTIPVTEAELVYVNVDRERRPAPLFPKRTPPAA